jgi:hypothetical protein
MRAPTASRQPWWYVAAPLTLPLVLNAPPLRGWLEATMTWHMLVQIPLLIAAGWWFASSLPAEWRRRAAAYNPGGVAGLVLAVVCGAVVMTPRVLDAATYDGGADAIKMLCALGCGAAARLSWHAAGTPGQAFVVGNVAWMLAAAGLLLRDWPQRVCAAYLENDQRVAGTGLVVWSLVLAAAWVVPRFRSIREVTP